MTVWFLIVSYNRPALLKECVESFLNSGIEVTIAILAQGTSKQINSTNIDYYFESTPGYPAIKRKELFKNVEDNIKSNEYIVFTDDDVVFNQSLNKIHEIIKFTKSQHVETGLIQFAHNKPSKYDFKKIALGFTGGGIMVKKETYESFGGHGEDYLDDVELFIRSYLAGYQNYRCGFVFAKHKIRSDGGLRALIRERSGANHIRRSKLDRVYDGLVERTGTWLGFKLSRNAHKLHKDNLRVNCHAT